MKIAIPSLHSVLSCLDVGTIFLVSARVLSYVRWRGFLFSSFYNTIREAWRDPAQDRVNNTLHTTQRGILYFTEIDFELGSTSYYREELFNTLEYIYSTGGLRKDFQWGMFILRDLEFIQPNWGVPLKFQKKSEFT